MGVFVTDGDVIFVPLSDKVFDENTPCNCVNNPLLLNKNTTITNPINARDIGRKFGIYPTAPINRIASIHLQNGSVPVKSSLMSEVSDGLPDATVPRTPDTIRMIPNNPKRIGTLRSS